MSRNVPVYGRETPYGFEFGPAKVERWTVDGGSVLIGVTTKREELHVRVTPTGLIRTSIRKSTKPVSC